VEASTLSTSEMREDKREIGQIRSQLQDPNLDEDTRARLQNRIGELERNVSRHQNEQRQSQTGIDHLREMSTVYRERIEVLKPFLPAIREEIANRGK
jgi:cob(I)alamin adenosyltransferase